LNDHKMGSEYNNVMSIQLNKVYSNKTDIYQ